MIPDEVLRAVQAAVRTKQSLIGDTRAKITTSQGVWTILHEMRNGSRWDLKVYAPRGERGRGLVYTSLAAVEQAYADAFADVQHETMEEYSSVESIAATLLQHQYRTHLFLKAQTKARQAQQRFHVSLKRKDELVRTRPETAWLMPPSSDARSLAEQCVALSNPKTFVELCTLADSVMTETLKTPTLATWCARAFRARTNRAILVAHLPSPTTRFRIGSVIVVADKVLSPVHQALLAQRFGNEWAEFVERVLSTDSHVVALDVYEDRMCTRHMGSIVLRRFVATTRDGHVPVVYIDSFASVTDASGSRYGKVLYQTVCELSLLNGIGAPYAIVMAQCLKIPFWEVRLDVGSLGGSLLFQLQHYFPTTCGSVTTQFPTKCMVGATRVDRDDL